MPALMPAPAMEVDALRVRIVGILVVIIHAPIGREVGPDIRRLLARSSGFVERSSGRIKFLITILDQVTRVSSGAAMPDDCQAQNDGRNQDANAQKLGAVHGDLL